MGVDIHGFWEANTPDGWLAFRKINYSRDYEWFGLLANIRRLSRSALTAVNGIPEDCSLAWQRYTADWGDGLHSHTYYCYKDICMLNEEYKKENDCDFILLPMLNEELKFIYGFGDPLPGRWGGTEIKSYWFGTLQELIQTDDLDNNVRYVCAFDS